MEFLIGGMAGMAAALFTNPFDVVKTRLQLQGELRARGQHAVHYRGALHGMLVIARADGVAALQKGLVPALAFQMCMNSTRLGLYHVAELNDLNKNKDGTISIPKSVVYAALAGTAGGLVGSPMYLIKTQIQSSSHGSIAVGQQHGHRGTWSACKNIYAAHGWRGFFKGIGSSVPRTTVGSATQLATFSSTVLLGFGIIYLIQWSLPAAADGSVKEALARRRVCENAPAQLALLASLVSALFIVIAQCPFDVVSTRLYNQGSDSRGKGLLYSGVADCIVKTYRKEGLFGFYKGIGPLYLRLAPHTVLSLVFWDKLKHYIKPTL